MIKNLVSSTLLLVLDFIWIILYMGNEYKIQIYKIQNSKPVFRLHYAIFAYLLMIIGLNLFVLPNIRKNNKFRDSLKYGFIFGIIIYGIYDFTCATIFKNWNMKLALIDIFWGGFVYFIVSYLSTFIDT